MTSPVCISVVRRAVIALGACAASSACGAGRYEVVRLVDGEQVPGTFVSEQAYADFTRGAVLEASGDAAGALQSYAAALENDSESAELWTRLGLLKCRLRQPEFEAAFDTAEHLDPSYEPLWRARAECLLERGNPEQALGFALRAASEDPLRLETSILVAKLYAHANRVAEAQRWLDGLIALHPRSPAAQRALRDQARARGDEARVKQADAALARLEPSVHEADTRALPEPISVDELDRRLVGAALDRARELSLGARVAPGELAVRAAALGRLDLASEQAGWLLAADPTDGDAWIAALVAADLARDENAFGDALAKIADQPSRPSALGAVLFGELLLRRVGADAARRWLESYGTPAAHDALTASCVARLERALGH